MLVQRSCATGAAAGRLQPHLSGNPSRNDTAVSHISCCLIEQQIAALQIARSTVQEYDQDGDGKLSFAEFQRLASQADFDATVLP